MKPCISFPAVIALALMISSQSVAIIGGQVDTSHDAVGVVVDGIGNRGTGVLIDSYWVLTAAFFADESSGGYFHVGEDFSNPDASYAISAAYPHVNFDPNTGDHNIALLRLATPVAGIAPIPYLKNASALNAGSIVQYVGYGQTSLYDGSNTIRHACANTVAEMDAWSFATYSSSSGPYFGDSGGPALLEVGGVPYVAGLVSLFAADELQYTICPRVSVYDAFIEAVMDAYPPLSAVETEAPGFFGLQPCVPNPFNPSTTIRFTPDEPQHIRVAVYDISGRLIRILLDGSTDSGQQTIEWNGRDGSGLAVSSGSYFLRLQGERVNDVRKLMLVR